MNTSASTIAQHGLHHRAQTPASTGMKFLAIWRHPVQDLFRLVWLAPLFASDQTP
jgi:hypothetical protein